MRLHHEDIRAALLELVDSDKVIESWEMRHLFTELKYLNEDGTATAIAHLVADVLRDPTAWNAIENARLAAKVVSIPWSMRVASCEALTAHRINQAIPNVLAAAAAQANITVPLVDPRRNGFRLNS